MHMQLAINAKELAHLQHMPNVIFEAPNFVVVSPDTSIEENSLIGCGVHLLGETKIGRSCSIGHYNVLKNCTIGNNVKIHSHCVLENVTIMDGAEIGPFAHLKEHTVIQEKAVIGNFVEVTRSTIGKESKAKHLSYLGDAELGEQVNVGAGTITCNYNGVSKHKTVIKNNARIGSDNCLVAPITIGEGAITGAGSTLTQNVPDHALALERNQQVTKEEYAPLLLEKYHQEKKAIEDKK
jgi:bifunctional UDP-N-acetylglucosamine pyrophosphorylase/glucosamine-1-phosphate N-acetyltransferase